MNKRILHDIKYKNNMNIIIEKTTKINEIKYIIDCSIVINIDTIYDIKIFLNDYPFKQPNYQIYPMPQIITNDNEEIGFCNGSILFNNTHKQIYPCGGAKVGFIIDLEQIIRVLNIYIKPVVSQHLLDDMNSINNNTTIKDSLRKYNKMVTLRHTIKIYDVIYSIFMETINYPIDMLSYRIFPNPPIKKNNMISFPNGLVIFHNEYIKVGFIEDLKEIIKLVEENTCMSESEAYPSKHVEENI